MEIQIDQIIRTNRRTIALIVNHDARLVIRAPYYTSIKQINELVDKKKNWIIEKQKYFQKKNLQIREKSYASHEKFLYLGEYYLLKIVAAGDETVALRGNRIEICRDILPEAEKHVAAWYRNQAREVIRKRVEWFSEITGYRYRTVKISSARKRWGSCGPKGSLNFNWRLVMAPMSVIDYVVVHELVHITEKNHSKRFWAKVKDILPGYLAQKSWLDENGQMLTL